MPDFDLSTLSGPELRSLLDSTRKRGQAAQAYRILQEMDARRAREPRREGGERPRTISVDLGDPLDRRDPLDDEPQDAAPPADTFDAELAMALQDRRPARRSTSKPAPKPRRAKREREPSWDEAARPPRAERRRGWGPLGIAASVALGIVIGAGVARETLLAPATPAATAYPQAPMLQIDNTAPPEAAPSTPIETASLDAPILETTPPVEEPAAMDAVSASTPASADEPTPDKVEPAPEPVAISASAPAPAEKACSGPPADRLICENPHLQQLQKDLRQAYADALAAHEDRATLRQRQLAWRDARNGVSDADQLARLYQDRIRKLNAATAQARRERERSGKDA